MVAFVMRCAKVAVLAALAIGLAPGVSQADTASDAGTQASVSCPAGRLCLYQDTNFTGLARRFTVNLADYKTMSWWNFETDKETDDDLNDGLSSVINKSDGWVRLYQNDHYRGRVICLGKNSSVHRLGIFVYSTFPNKTMDNAITSHSFDETTACDFRVEPNQNR